MLARRLTTILPAMTLPEAIETTRIHSVAGLTSDHMALVTTRPFRAPHHTISDVGLIGGGQIPMPGEVSLAHHGLRCLDERPEFRRHVLEVLRQPLEESVIYRQSRGRPRPVRLGGDRRSDHGTDRQARNPVPPHGAAPRQGSLVVHYGNGSFGRTRLTSPSESANWHLLIVFPPAPSRREGAGEKDRSRRPVRPEGAGAR
jgi:Magnesium chelatase, subunit ChlI